MATVELSGYLAAASTVSWTSGQDLNALSDNEWTNLSDAIDNSTNNYLFADVEVILASAAFSGLQSGMEIFVVPSVDGTNYPNWTGNVTTGEQENNQYFVGFVTLSGATEAQRVVLRNVQLPSGSFSFALRSRAGVATAASGNSLRWRPHSYANA